MNNENTNLIQTTNLYNEAERRLEELIRIRQKCEKELINVPEGRIHIVKSADRVQYYLRENKTDKSGKYISKSETETIEKYVHKAYVEKAIKLMDVEIHNLKTLINKSDKVVDKLRNIYSDYPNEIKQIIEPVDISDEDYRELWLSGTYERKAIPEYLTIFETKRKEKVRSKSELNIANTLEDYGIPYKYECPIKLSNGITVYPDFTVLNVRTRQTYYWEHRGMMDDKEYSRHAVSKMKTYMKSGICVGKNLIITEETSTDPLGTNEIKMIIKEYFE